MTRVAIVHDYLTQRGGAERVVLAMHQNYPDAPIHTSLFDPACTFPEFADADVRPLVLNRSARLRRSHRLAFPMLAPAFSALRVDADVVICSSSGWAHGVRTTGRKLVYCYTPARWLYQADRTFGDASRLALIAARLGGPPLRSWDRRRARTAASYAGISTAVASRIRDEYGTEPVLIPPPITLDASGPMTPVAGIEPGFDLCVSRLMPYKNVEALVAPTVGGASRPVVVVGDGPDGARLRALARPDVTFLASVTDEQLRWLYASCRFLLAASFEDFGLTPLEAAAFGKPSIVLRFGGFLDTVVEGVTGMLFDHPVPELVADAIHRAETMTWDPEEIRARAQHFSTAAFDDRLRAWVGSASHANPIPEPRPPTGSVGRS